MPGVNSICLAPYRWDLSETCRSRRAREWHRSCHRVVAVFEQFSSYAALQCCSEVRRVSFHLWKSARFFERLQRVVPASVMALVLKEAAGYREAPTLGCVMFEAAATGPSVFLLGGILTVGDSLRLTCTGNGAFDQ
jgi:hypothetical protein